MLKELLDRAQEAGITKIRFSDKLTRTKDLTTSKALQERLRTWGYVVINNNRSITTEPTPSMIELKRKATTA